ncbi:cytotoxic T-lymphocyte protein 4 [Ambystoma mexicanum]|uniref:cytotoxic T-lymphocyte protein 4 n=1 Tax=Ambystoma mexicanum TaxID=8296 RepID=UPI0037E91DFC
MKNLRSFAFARILTSLVTVGFVVSSASGSKGIQVNQPAVVVANELGNADLVCGYTFTGQATEIRGTLLKKEGARSTVVCAMSFTTDYEALTTEGASVCHGQPGPGNLTFTLSKLRAANTGVYTCVIEIMYPPPYRTSVGSGTLLYATDPLPCHESQFFHWVLLGIIAGLCIYSALITAALTVNKMRSKCLLNSDLSVEMTSAEEAQERKGNTYHILFH